MYITGDTDLELNILKHQLGRFSGFPIHDNMANHNSPLCVHLTVRKENETKRALRSTRLRLSIALTTGKVDKFEHFRP